MQLSIRTSKGSGVVYIALPIKKTNDFKFITSSKNTNNLILLGELQYPKDFIISQISLDKNQASYIEMAFKNIIFDLKESTHSSEIFSLPLYFGETEKIIEKNNFSNKNKLFIESLTFLISEYSESYPSSTRLDASEVRYISGESLRKADNKIVLYLKKVKDDLIVYLVLGIMGILLGFVTAPKFISNTTRAYGTLILGLIGVAGISYFIFWYLTPEQRFTDTTTIVTFGTIIGLIIGSIAAALHFLWKHSSSNKVSD